MPLRKTLTFNFSSKPPDYLQEFVGSESGEKLIDSLIVVKEIKSDVSPVGVYVDFRIFGSDLSYRVSDFWFDLDKSKDLEQQAYEHLKTLPEFAGAADV
jgi:hypothetical protein